MHWEKLYGEIEDTKSHRGLTIRTIRRREKKDVASEREHENQELQGLSYRLSAQSCQHLRLARLSVSFPIQGAHNRTDFSDFPPLYGSVISIDREQTQREAAQTA